MKDIIAFSADGSALRQMTERQREIIPANAAQRICDLAEALISGSL